jgi:hypothetical protein
MRLSRAAFVLDGAVHRIGRPRTQCTAYTLVAGVMTDTARAEMKVTA